MNRPLIKRQAVVTNLIVDASLKQSHHDQSSSLNINQEFVNESEDDDEYNYNHLSITSLSVCTSQTNSLIILQNESIVELTIDKSCYNSNFTGSNEISSSEKLSLTQQHEDEPDTTKEDEESCSIVKQKRTKH
ncbi:unnamed protein product [Rotaria sordida]|uniref:Uncharacterized protein n=1 Tax=Rotaria sordida TaxID=392033 RepID=A0A814UXJ3_9BILA|nr:unnamed protein product [Rotaria sordida]CAF1441984.1 unnamed protein product [Rotaria sordida]